MIEVKVSHGNLSIVSTVSDFCGSMGYCEFKIPLALKGIKPPPTEATIEGAKAHQRQEQFEREHFEMVPVTNEELADLSKDVEFAYESINTRLIVPLSFPNYPKAYMLIFGRADKVYRSRGTLIVEESKFPFNPSKYLETYEPYPDHKLQTLLYLNSLFGSENSLESRTWFEIPHSQKAWIIKVKDRKTGDTIRTFKGLQTKELEQYMNINLQRFAQIATGELLPQHHQRQAKCAKCRIENCQHALSLK
jgi:uncharacterized FlaG/YvyC family protein